MSSFYDSSVYLYLRVFESFRSILTKAKAHAPATADSYVTARLSEDMLPLNFQIHIAAVLAVKCLSRLVPEKGPYPDFKADELKTIDDLLARVDKVHEILSTITPEDIAGAATKPVALGLGPGLPEVNVDGRGYVLGYATPNVFFHVSMAYAILRNQGVPLGKQDYLGAFLVQPVPNLQEIYAAAKK